MNKYLLTIATAALAVSFTGHAQLTRESHAAPANVLSSDAERMLPLPAGYDRLVRTAVNTPEEPGYLRQLKRLAKVPATRNAARSATGKTASIRATVQATSLNGFMSWVGAGHESGWYNVTWPQPSCLWEAGTTIRCSAGFMREGLLYAFYSTSTSYGIEGAGLNIIDAATGTVEQSINYELFDSYARIVTDVAYDPVTDVAYVVTYNDNGSQLILQRFNPADGTFTNLGVALCSPESNDAPMAMTWSPAENAPYMITFNKDVKRYDTRNKRFVTTGTSDYDFAEYAGAMTYSPKDDAFIGLLPGYDYMDNEMCDVVLIKPNGTTSYISTFAYDCQWSVLTTADSYLAPTAPAEVTVATVNIDGPATAGTIDVVLPSTCANGSAIAGKVYLQVKIDGTLQSGSTVSGAPGATVPVSVSVSEGLHNIAITPYILGDDGMIYGTATYLRRYFGYDTPAMPENVTLTENIVKWDAVTSGANNGYIDAADVTYNVFVNGTLMNAAPISGTSLAISLPDNGAVSHRASVVAIAGGKSSEEGISAPLYASGTLSVPVFLGPDPGERDMAEEVRAMFTIVKDPANTNSARHWQYDQQDPWTGGFYCLCPYESTLGNKGDEWLFLPAINFDDTETIYRLEMEVWAGNHYFSSDETYEVALCKRPSGSNPTIIREAETIHKAANFQLSETLFKVPSAGVYYIGIHYISPVVDSYRLYARNFRVEKTASTDNAPAEVTALAATACELGELAANVTFNMPAVSVSGTALDTTTDITATIETEAGSTTVTGKPGNRMQAKVAAMQGNNTVKVTTSSAGGNGKLAETTVYCGVYRPGSVDLDYAVSDDNNTITLSWSLDEYNDNDEFTGPDQCTYTVYRRLNDQWRAAASVGHDRTWSFTVPDASTQDIYQFAVAATNAAGTSEVMSTAGAILGTPYALPFHETFPYNGQEVNMREPIMIESLSYLPAMWSFTDPADVEDGAANTSGIAICAMGESLAQMTLPKFSTKGLNNVKFELSLYFGDRTPSEITVLASSPQASFIPVASFTPADGKGWVNKLISLPASCQNQGWISLSIRANIVGYSQALLIDGYALSNYPDEMMTIDSFNGPTRCVVGEPSTFTVNITNAGSTASAAPSYTMQMLTDGGAVDLTCELPSGLIEPASTVAYTFTYTPAAAHTGNVLARFTLPEQPSGAVTETEHNITVLNARLPVVDDLSGTASDGNVTLTWSKPRHTENFEAFEPWDYSESMRGFINLDRDGNNVYNITEVAYPGKNLPKGYQVFSSAATDNPLLAAHSGEQYLIAFSSASMKATDNWLISPEVKGGTEVSFWMNLLLADYPETLLVMWSDGSTDPDDFKEVDGGYICPGETGWKQYAVTLPANARRFALWHVGDAGDDLFGFMLDDLSFEPANPTVVAEGYNIYRNGQLLAADVTANGYTDTDVDLSVPVQYVVRTVGHAAGEKVESDRSNVVWVDATGIDNVLSDGTRAIAGGYGEIILTGFNSGDTVRVFNSAGALTATATTATGSLRIGVQPGLYIVDCAGIHAKVAVR